MPNAELGTKTGVQQLAETEAEMLLNVAGGDAVVPTVLTRPVPIIKAQNAETPDARA